MAALKTFDKGVAVDVDDELRRASATLRAFHFHDGLMALAACLGLVGGSIASLASRSCRSRTIFAASASRFSGWCGFNDRAVEMASTKASRSAAAMVFLQSVVPEHRASARRAHSRGVAGDVPEGTGAPLSAPLKPTRAGAIPFPAAYR
jgi:hypothetical protein